MLSTDSFTYVSHVQSKPERQLLTYLGDPDEGEEGEYVSIETKTHPTHLAWSQSRSNSNAPPKVHGLFRLYPDEGEVVEYTYVTGIEGETSRGTTELHESMQERPVQNNAGKDWFGAMAASEERTLFLRGSEGDTLQEWMLVSDEWEYGGKIETSLKENQGDPWWRDSS